MQPTEMPEEPIKKKSNRFNKGLKIVYTLTLSTQGFITPPNLPLP
jgi:hypothetical protein